LPERPSVENTEPEQEKHLDQVRRELVQRARRPRSRVRDNPNKWHPTEVTNPAFGDVPFTEAGAWEFLADQLEQGLEFWEVEQDDPPGVKAYEMTIDLGNRPEEPSLYVKLRLGHGNRVMGRSFHYSTRQREISHERGR
jgi:hypothetical protein